MALRNLHTDLKAALVQNDEFIISHLIRFEKPVPSDQATAGYVYVTDGPYEIVYDENTYLPNKVLNLGTIREETLAKASAMTLQLSATALGINVSTNVTFNDTNDYLEIGQNAVEAGFKEGDTIDFEHASSTHTFEIISFAEGATGIENGKIFVTPKSSDYTGFTNVAGVITQANPEVKSLLLDHINDSTKASYIHREVLIDRAYINPETGSIIGEPVRLFIGYINKGSLKEDVTKGSSVTWSLTNHWGDFVKIQGRKTSDNEHRALGIDDIPDEVSIHREEYKTDYGFEHSQRAVNTIANFMGKEKRFRFKKSGFLGLGSGRTIEYDVDVEREVDIRFNLSAKYLPIVYGVRKIDSFPIFADAFKNIDSGKVVTAHALCEGDIAGIFDIHVDDQSAVCIDSVDYGNRSEDAPFLCQGNAVRGDVIKSAATNLTFSGDAIANLTNSINLSALDLQFDWSLYSYNTTVPTVEASNTDSLDTNPVVGAGRSCYLSKPTPVIIDVFTGQSEQRASDRLRKYSDNQEFKIQEDYFDNSKFYWSGNHRLLDTAYTVSEFNFSDASAVIPKMEYVVKGKYINCYGYDFCLDTGSINPRLGLNIGDKVQFYDTADTLLNSTEYTVLELIATRKPANRDTHASQHDDGTRESYRMRFNGLPSEVTSTGIVARAKKVGTNTYVDGQYDTSLSAPIYSDVVTIEEIPAVTITGLTGTSGADTGNMIFTLAQNSTFEEAMAAFSVTKSTYFSSHNVQIFNETRPERWYTLWNNHGVNSYDASTNKLTMEHLKFSDNAAHAAYLIEEDIANGDTVKIQLNSVVKGDVNWTVAGATPSRKVKFKQSNGLPPKVVVPTNVSGRYMLLGWLDSSNGPLPAGLATDSVQSFSENDDFRVSTNPVIQLLDYLTNPRYGKGLDLVKDINLESFRTAARDCDERSEVTITVLNTASVSENQVYKLTDIDDNLIFQGTVSNVSDTITVGSSEYKEVTFKDVIGKLLHRHDRDRRVSEGHYVYNTFGVIRRATGDGYYTTEQYNALPAVSNNSLNLTRVDASGTLAIQHTSNDPSYRGPNGNPVVKSFVPGSGFVASGYSLYDSDDVKYWRFLGWDEPVQDNVTRHQCNIVLDTSKSLFSNVNLLLRQFNGILRYSAGKYEVVVKKDAPSVENADSITIDSTEYTPSKIDKDDIIGSLKIDSAATKDTYNSVTSSIIDPQNKFGGREVTFFNSDYLKQDRGISKQGNFSMAGVTNYFNARINIQQFLDESRGGLTVSFTTKPQAVLLLAGDFIYLTHEDYGFEDKVFRISNIGIKDNGLVDITAKEHNSKAYKLRTARGKKEVTEGSGESNQDLLEAPVTAISSESFTATIGVQTVELSWTQSSAYSPATHQVEVWRKGSGDSGDYGIHIATVSGDEFTDKFTQIDQSDTYQYWVRYVINVQQPGEQGVFQRFSAYTNKGEANNGGLQAIVAPLNAANINYGDDGTEVSLDDLKPNEVGADNTSGQVNNGVTVNQDNGGFTFDDNGNIKSDGRSSEVAADATQAGFWMGYNTTSSKYTMGIGDHLESMVWDGSNLSITGELNATSGSIANSITIGGTAASTVESGAAAGATASQVNVGLALITNKHKNADNSLVGNNGDAILVGVDKNGTPIVTQDGFIQWEGSKITIETNQYNSGGNNILTILTGSPGRKGFIIFDTAKGNPFTVHGGGIDVAFAWKIGTQWYYDNNGDNAGTTFTPAASYVAIGYLETTTSDLITKGGLFGHPVPVDQAAFPGDEQISGTVGGWTIDSDAIFSGTKDTSGYNGENALTISSAGSLHAKEFYIDTDGGAHFAGEITIGTSDSVFKADATSGIHLGAAAFDGAPFSVSMGGSLIARDADFAGTIRASALLLDDNAIIQNNVATSVADSSITLDSLNNDVIAYIDTQASGYAQATAGDNRTSTNNIDKDTTEDTAFQTFSNFDHGINNPTVSTSVTSFMYLPDFHQNAGDLNVEFKIYARTSYISNPVTAAGSWTLIRTISKSATSQVIPQNPAFTRYLHTLSFVDQFVHSISSDDDGKQFDYKIELSHAPEYADNDIGVFFGVQEVGTAGSINASTLNALGSSDFMRSTADTETTEYIKHAGDTDTHLRFETDKITLTAGSHSMITMDGLVGADLITLHENVQADGDLTVTGNLNITGDINSYNVTDLDVTDKTITVGSGQIAENSGSSGLIVDRGDSTDASILWNQTNSNFDITEGVHITKTILADQIYYPLQITATDTDSNVVDQTGDSGVGIKFRIAGDDATPLVGASIAAMRESDTDANKSTGLAFFTSQNDEVLDEALRISHEGKVGIGTDTPANKLEVTGGTIIANGGGTFDPAGDGPDTSATVAIAIPSGQRIIGSYNGYIRNLIDFTQSQPIIIGQTGTTLLRGVELHCGNAYGVKIKNSDSSATLTINEDSHISTKSTSVSGTSAIVIDSFAHATYRSAKYTIQITQGTKYQTSDIMVIHDGSTPIATEYAMLETNGVLGTFDVAISGDNVELKVTMAAADESTVRAVRHSIRV